MRNSRKDLDSWQRPWRSWAAFWEWLHLPFTFVLDSQCGVPFGYGLYAREMTRDAHRIMLMPFHLLGLLRRLLHTLRFPPWVAGPYERGYSAALRSHPADGGVRAAAKDEKTARHWPWVSRRAFDLLVNERDRLRQEVDRLLEHRARVERVEHRMPEAPYEKREPQDPMPEPLRKFFAGHATAAIGKMRADRARDRHRAGESWRSIALSTMPGDDEEN